MTRRGRRPIVRRRRRVVRHDRRVVDECLELLELLPGVSIAFESRLPQLERGRELYLLPRRPFRWWVSWRGDHVVFAGDALTDGLHDAIAYYGAFRDPSSQRGLVIDAAQLLRADARRLA